MYYMVIRFLLGTIFIALLQSDKSGIGMMLGVHGFRTSLKQPAVVRRMSVAPRFNTPMPKGEKGTKSYRLFFDDGTGKIISPWHDIPLRVRTKFGDRFNFVCEIPKFSRDKMEVATKEANNPIAQDLNAFGDLRQYPGPIYWNYGCLPQTWEDPNHLHPDIKCYGDNDPLDVVEIGSEKLAMGSVSPVSAKNIKYETVDNNICWVGF
jgi:inorganic pyrophosphatase